MGYKYRMITRELAVVEKWMAWENMLNLRPRAWGALDDKYRMNLDGRKRRAGGGHLCPDDGPSAVGRIVGERRRLVFQVGSTQPNPCPVLVRGQGDVDQWHVV